MVVNDTVYENFYNYMMNLLYARSLTGYADPYYSGRGRRAARKTGEIGTSFCGYLRECAAEAGCAGEYGCDIRGGGQSL